MSSMYLEPWLSMAETVANITQSITIIIATLFTAWWAYATFGHKEKTDELMAIARKISEIHTLLDRSVSQYKWHKLHILSLQTISPKDVEKENEKYLQRVREQEAALDVLLDELEELQFLSFQVPIAFRILDMITYKQYIKANKDISKLAQDQEAVSKTIEVKHKILSDIERQINAHRKVFNRIRIICANTVFHTKNLFKAKK
ncbi:hypothetical protein BH11PAT2_BH11PAT2_00530 [soil metagenome]